MHEAFYRGGGYTSGILLLPLAFVIVHPREALEWLSHRTGKTYYFRHIVRLELAATSAMILLSLGLDAIFPRFTWIHPLMALGAVGLIRLLKAVVRNVFGFDD